MMVMVMMVMVMVMIMRTIIEQTDNNMRMQAHADCDIAGALQEEILRNHGQFETKRQHTDIDNDKSCLAKPINVPVGAGGPNQLIVVNFIQEPKI